MNTPSIHTLVHIGAGNGGQLPLYEKLNLSRVILIEPLPGQARYLRQSTANMPNTEVWELAISCEHHNQSATLTEYNLAQASSLHDATGLLELYPGIKVVQQHQVATITPAALIERLQLPTEQQHQLVVEANGEETAILHALAEQQLLTLFSNIELTLPNTALYNSIYDPQALQQWLSAHCFERKAENTDDPDTSIYSWQRNPLKLQITELSQQKSSLKQQLINSQAASAEQHKVAKAQQAEHKIIQEQLNAKLAEQATHIEQILASSKIELTNAAAAQLSTEEELNKYKTYFANRKQQHEAAELRITELTQALAEATAELTGLREQLQNQQNSHSKLTALEQKMEQLFAKQAEQLVQNTNALGQHVTKMHANSSRQWQATLAVQHSLQHGELPLQFSDTSISPELAQHLITLVQNNNYDLIIEFGSGHSTSLLARALLSQSKRWQGNGQLALQNGEPQTQLAPSEHDLLKRVISFEHNKSYHQQTQKSLQQQGLSQIVELVHAPLVNCTFSPEHLFYDCEPKLQQLANLLQNEEKHILVLVDGPSAEPTAQSRTPALPALLNHFARHRLDVVLDDHHRDSEQQSAEQWRSQLAERSLGFKEHIWAGDKSALLLSINS